MKFHFNSIIEDHNGNYIYEYHTLKKSEIQTLGYFSVAGIIGTFKIWKHVSSTELLLFWSGVFILSKLVDWFIEKTDLEGRSISIRFVSKYPHYFFTDILWMLECNGQKFMLGELISEATDSLDNIIDIGIGTLSAKQITKADFTKETLNKAVAQQAKLQNEWSERTGEKYPKLGMPKR